MGKIIKDALILFAITLVAGVLLGVVYEVTKAPIAEQNELAKQKAAEFAASLKEKAVSMGNINLVVLDSCEDANMLRNAAIAALKDMPSTAIVAAYELQGKPGLLLGYSDDLVAAGKNAGKEIREAAKFIQGGGGGQNNIATAGGKNSAGLAEALETLKALATK